MESRILISLCGRAGSKGFKNKNLKTFCGKSLAHYSLAAADLFLRENPHVCADIVLNTDSGLLRELVLSRYPEVKALQRPAALAGDTVPKMAVFQHSLREMESHTGNRYDFLLDLDITSPLRTVEDIQNCLTHAYSRPDLEVVMSAVKSRRSPYMNMAQRAEDGLVHPVVRTNFTARQQTPQCYDLNASIYVFRRAFLLENETAFLWDGRCDVVEMEDTAILDIDSEEDFEWMEYIAKYLFARKPQFAKVREAIR